MLKTKIGAVAGSAVIGFVMDANALAGPIDALGNFNAVQTRTGGQLGAKSATEVIGSVIGVFLSLLGVIALIFIIWAGFTWMMSKGDPTKVKAAQDMMKAAVVGLIVVLASYSIASFVITNLNTATR